MTQRRAVFLDRDGVLNKVISREGRAVPPSSLAELELLPGVVEACRALRQAGFLLLVVTNQPDVARGTQVHRAVEAINRSLQARLLIDDVYVCYHDEGDRCHCRKPEPGLLLEAAHKWNADLEASFVVGDRKTDIIAGNRAGCTTVLISPSREYSGDSDYRERSLLEAVQAILCHNGSG